MPWKVIEYQNKGGQVLVARMPPEGTGEFVSGTQLIVQQGQVAAFFHGGKPTDVFGAGTHNLSTQNLPVLGKLMKLATLGSSPFRSYVYFVALKTFTNLGWGTSSPILFRDSEFKMVNLRAHGAFSIRVANPSLLLKMLVGTQGMETAYAVEEYLKKIIVSRLTQTLPEVLTSVLDLPIHYQEIAVKVRTSVHDEFDQYGLELVDLIVEAITLPESVQEAIDRATGTRAVDKDELDRYERTARSDALRDAAKQPGNAGAGGMSAGLGIGAGMQIAKEMASPGAGSSGGLSVDEVRAKLAELKSLVEEDLITQEDFEAQKKRLLEKI